jgi:hypothetical protein
MKPTIDVNDANFESEVLKSEQPVLVGFATGWALPSMTTEEALEEIATESASWKVLTWTSITIQISGCGTVFGVFQQSCALLAAKNGSEFLARQPKKQFSLNLSRPSRRVRLS